MKKLIPMTSWWVNASVKITLLFLLCLSGFCADAQQTNYEARTIVPPSPNVAALGKYGAVPVSLYTGVPSISIPLYEIQDGSLQLPISISYHAGGIRVEEIASAVGLGWSLNAGGVINRQVRDIPDERNNWVGPVQNHIQTLLQGTSQQRITMAHEISTGMRDSEPDIYSYSMNGQSGKFLFDQSGTIFNYPAKNRKITPWSTFSAGAGWKIVVEDGTVYEFNKTEVVSGGGCGEPQPSNAAWLLTKIKSADGTRTITFTYVPVTYYNQFNIVETKYFTMAGSTCGNITPSPCGTNSQTQTHRLTQISFSGGYVNFTYDDTDRQDLPGEKSLKQVAIYNSNGLLKKYDFAYSYFGSGDQYEKRLKLNSMTEKSLTGIKPPHEFTYEESIPMPNRLSYSQDFWGFNNAQPNSTLIPPFFTFEETGTSFVASNANRNANPLTMQACILKKIKYPTGGETLFCYEPNTVNDFRIEPTFTTGSIPFERHELAFSALTSPFEESEFTIPPIGSKIKLYVSGLATSGNPTNCEAGFHCYLIKDNNMSSPYMELSDTDNGIEQQFPAGTYKLVFVFNCTAGNLDYNITLQIKTPVEDKFYSRTVGGLRIREMEDRPAYGGKPVIKRYRYDFGDPLKSSGVLVRFPEYGYVMEHMNCDSGYNPCFYQVRQSATNYPLASSMGYVGYGEVMEDLGDNGKVVHTYIAFTTPSKQYPFVPADEYDWERGAETSTSYYAWKNEQYVLSKQIGYKYFRASAGSVFGLKLATQRFYSASCAIAMPDLTWEEYTIYPEFFELEQIEEVVFDQDNTAKHSRTLTDYTYDATHLQLKEVRKSLSSADSPIRDELIVRKKYAEDYSSGASGNEALGIQKLKDLHIVNVPIEEFAFRQRMDTITYAITDQRVISGTITTFKPDNPYPAEVFRLETDATIPLATYGSGSSLSSGSFIRNANTSVANAYKSAVIFHSYDVMGNLTMQQKPDDVYTSYLWGYGKNYPVAQVVGATYSTISAQITQSVLDTPSSDQVLRDELNAVRTGLSSTKALVTTFTYMPLIGNTSVTDANNRTVYYEYDSFGRLALVKDHNLNIVKKYCYNYAGQQENCGL